MPGDRLVATKKVEGFVAPGFEGVERAFWSTLNLEGERGAAFAVVRDGETLIDIWGGTADARSGRPWEKETIQVIFSGTKALTALCMLMLVDRGKLDHKAPVASYWPEFAAHGKSQITVAECLSHRAGLPGIAAPVSEDDLIDSHRMAALLAAQPQETDPRAADAYHPLTYGWLCGELVQRIDGRSVGRFFAEEVAAPLDLELWIGLPPERESSVAWLEYAPTWGQRPQWDQTSLDSDELLARIWDNPALFPADRLPWNRVDWHRAEIPGGGGIGSARSLARLYGCLAQGGEIDGIRLLSSQALTLGREEMSRRNEALVGEPQAFAFGFQLQTERHVYGPPEKAFGHSGAGGSIHCAWPEEQVGVSYAMNTLRDDEPVDLRSSQLLDALYTVIAGS